MKATDCNIRLTVVTQKPESHDPVDKSKREM